MLTVTDFLYRHCTHVNAHRSQMVSTCMRALHSCVAQDIGVSHICERVLVLARPRERPSDSLTVAKSVFVTPSAGAARQRTFVTDG